MQNLDQKIARKIDHKGSSDATSQEVRIEVDREVHVVARGDTLHSISWRYRLDYREVARWNRITAPFIIYPGQRLALHQTQGSRTAPRQTESKEGQKATLTIPVTRQGVEQKSRKRRENQERDDTNPDNEVYSTQNKLNRMFEEQMQRLAQ